MTDELKEVPGRAVILPVMDDGPVIYARPSKMMWKTSLILSVPLGLMAFLVVTARAVVDVIDGPAETIYGFPLFWIKAGSTSLSAVLDLAAASVDLLVYVLVTWCGMWAATRVWPGVVGSRLERWFAWAGAVAILIICAMSWSFDPSVGGVTFDPMFRWSGVKQYSFYLGVPKLEH